MSKQSNQTPPKMAHEAGTFVGNPVSVKKQKAVRPQDQGVGARKNSTGNG